MMLASGGHPEGLGPLTSRGHMDVSCLPLSIPCTTSPMFPGILKLDKSVYSSPPPAPNIPENNVCKLLEYRSHKVAAFTVNRRELICLPQAFELFLKHLVGGLHTVYTKLKRLGIMPVVCNVEQVRILRGLGAIQPGVNRCKLIAPTEFDVLYEDCTNSSARPGRPPKRGSPSPLKEHDISLFRPKQSRLDSELPAAYSPYKWMDIMKSSPLFGNGYYYPPQFAAAAAAHMPFMHHPAMMANMVALGHLPPRPPINGVHEGIGRDLPGAGHLKDLAMDRSKHEELMLQREKNNNTAPPPPAPNPPDTSARSQSRDPCQQRVESRGSVAGGGRDGVGRLLGGGGADTGLGGGEMPLDLNTRDRQQGALRSRRASVDDSGASSDQDDLSDADVDLSSPSGSLPSDSEVVDQKQHIHNHDDSAPLHRLPTSLHNPPPCTSSSLLNSAFPARTLPQFMVAPTNNDISCDGAGRDDGPGPDAASMVTLLMNVQGLLRMAIESAKQREQKMFTERAELRREMSDERERRQHLQLQLSDTHTTIMSLQRKLRREKKLLRRLKDTLLQSQGLSALSTAAGHGLGPDQGFAPQREGPQNTVRPEDQRDQGPSKAGSNSLRVPERLETGSHDLRCDVIRVGGGCVERRDRPGSASGEAGPEGRGNPTTDATNGRNNYFKEEPNDQDSNEV